jgi:hypothetical protein
MTSSRRPFLALFSGLAFMIGVSPAGSVVLTDSAPLVSPPVTVTSSNPLLVAFDFGQSFASVISASFSLTFAGDLWDINDLWFLDGVGGQVNLGGPSSSVAHLNISPSNTAFYADLLDGTFSTNLTGLDFFTTTSFGLASIALQIDAIPLAVAEPASLALLAGGLAGLARVRRRAHGMAGASLPPAIKRTPCAA